MCLVVKVFIAPSDRLIIAAVGIGGKGEVDINYLSGSGNADIAVLCDVDDRRAAKDQGKSPRQNITRTTARCWIKSTSISDAVSVATPDHMHAVIAMASMQLKKHVYVQKPLTHDIYEARMLTQAGRTL